MSDRPDPSHLPAVEMVLPSMPTAGMEVMVARMVRRLAGRGHRVGVTCIEEIGALGEELADEGVRVTLVPTPGLGTILRAPALEGWLAASGADVVHVHSGAWLKAAGAARRAGLPVVATMHGIEAPEPWYYPGLLHWAGRRSDRVIAVSESVVEYLGSVARLPRSRVSLIPNGICTERFASGGPAGAFRERLGIPRSAPLVGHVARLDPVKNQPLLLEAFALLRREVPDAVLAIVGDGAMRADLESRIAALGLEGAVHVVGVVRDVAPLYRDFDLFVLSSRTEGTSMSMLEAMASGVPCVATAVGGNPALLDHGRCGALVPPDDPRLLADAMRGLILDGERRDALSAAARDRVEKHYSEKAMLDSYAATYRSVVLKEPGSQPVTEAACAV